MKRLFHGMSHNRLYRTWAGIKRRCDYPYDKDHKYYYDKGITYCDEWKEFIPFMEWALANGYNDDLTIERKDNNKGYCPENCTWIPRSDQAKNKTNGTHLIIAGIDKSYTEWSNILKVHVNTLKGRGKRHKDLEILRPINNDLNRKIIIYCLWHKDLISILPDQYLIQQWVICYSISFDLALKETLNDSQINKILDFSMNHFYSYLLLIYNEMILRKIIINQLAIEKIKNNLEKYCGYNNFIEIKKKFIYQKWMNEEYMIQCLIKLKEKYDNEEIELKDWFKIVNGVYNIDKTLNKSFSKYLF